MNTDLYFFAKAFSSFLYANQLTKVSHKYLRELAQLVLGEHFVPTVGSGTMVEGGLSKHLHLLPVVAGLNRSW